MNVLLSIKPKYVDEILSGAKKYEFRRVIFRKSVETIYIYCNSSVKRVFGSFTMGGIPEGTPEEIWNPCHQYDGITGAALFKYFKNASKAYAIKIRNSHRFDAPIDPFTVLPDFSPPQSFRIFPRGVRRASEEGRGGRWFKEKEWTLVNHCQLRPEISVGLDSGGEE